MDTIFYEFEIEFRMIKLIENYKINFLLHAYSYKDAELKFIRISKNDLFWGMEGQIHTTNVKLLF